MSKLQNLVNKIEKLLKPLPHIPNHWRENFGKKRLVVVSCLCISDGFSYYINDPDDIYGFSAV